MQYKPPNKLLPGFGLLLISVLLAACGGSGPATPVATPVSEAVQVTPVATASPIPATPTVAPEQPTDTPAPTATEAPRATDTALSPTDTPPTTATLQPPPVVSAFGQTEEGLYFRGSPDPTAVTVIDYSDFL